MPTQSPRSMSATNRANASSPSSALLTKSWSVPVPSRSPAKHELPLIAPADHPARDAHDVVARGAGLDPIVPLLADRAERVGAVETDGIRVVAAGAHVVDARQPSGALVAAGPTFGFHQRFRSKMIRKP